MVLSSAIVCDYDRRIAGDRRSVFPYDRRRSQNFLRSYGNQLLNTSRQTFGIVISIYFDIMIYQIIKPLHTQSFFYIIVYQSFYGALLTCSYFLVQGKILCFARVGKSLARCLFRKGSEEMICMLHSQ